MYLILQTRSKGKTFRGRPNVSRVIYCQRIQGDHSQRIQDHIFEESKESSSVALLSPAFSGVKTEWQLPHPPGQEALYSSEREMINTRNTRSLFRMRSRMILRKKANRSSMLRGNIGCRHCDTGADETQEHLEVCTGLSHEQRGLKGFGL